MKKMLILLALLACAPGAMAKCQRWDYGFVLVKNQSVDYFTPPSASDLFQHLARSIRKNEAARGVDLYRMQGVGFCGSSQEHEFQPDAVAVLVSGDKTVAVRISYQEANELIQGAEKSQKAPSVR